MIWSQIPTLHSMKGVRSGRTDSRSPEEAKKKKNARLTKSTSPAASHPQPSSPSTVSRTRPPRSRLSQTHSRRVELSPRPASCPPDACAGNLRCGRLILMLRIFFSFSMTLLGHVAWERSPSPISGIFFFGLLRSGWFVLCFEIDV